MNHTISRRSILGAGLASVAFAQTPARADAEYTIKFATDVPDAHPINIYAREAAEGIRRDTDGRLDVQIFSNGQLGSQADMLSQLRSGALEVLALSGVNAVSTLVPLASAYGLGFAFSDYDAVWRAMDGAFGARLRAEMEKAGLVVMERIWDNGFRQVTTSARPIVEPHDLDGLKIRVPVSALWTSLFRSLGASPTGLSFGEVYSALQTRVVDGQENPPVVISSAKLYEVQKYCSLTNHMWDGPWVMLNKRVWSSLPSKLQEAFSSNVNSAALRQRVETAQVNQTLRAELALKGLIFNEVDPAPFKERLRRSGFYAEWRRKFGDDVIGLLEKAVGELG